MALTGVRWGELRASCVHWLSEVPFPQVNVERSHSDRYEEKASKSWRGTRPVPLSLRALAIFRHYATGKSADDYLFTNQQGGELSAGVARKFPLGFRRHALRHFAASTWLRLGTPSTSSPSTWATMMPALSSRSTRTSSVKDNAATMCAAPRPPKSSAAAGVTWGSPRRVRALDSDRQPQEPSRRNGP